MSFNLEMLREKLPNSEIVGDSHLQVSLCSSADDSLENSLCFTANEAQYLKAQKGAARAFVLPMSLKGKVIVRDGHAVLFVKNHSLAHAQLAEIIQKRYEGHETTSAFTHPTAVVSTSASLGKNVRVGSNVFIGENVKIGDHVFIGANTVIEDDSVIGNQTHIWPMVFIGRGCVIGDHCHIHPNTTIGSEGFGFAHDDKGHHHRIPQLGQVVLGNRVEVGSNVSIDRATFGSTVIGEGTKLDNLIHIAHNVRIGKNCLLTAGFKIAGSSIVGDNVITGGHVLVGDHIEICSNVRLAAWSGVNNDIREPGDYGGHPLQPLRDYLKTTMCLPHLPEFRKIIRQLQRQT